MSGDQGLEGTHLPSLVPPLSLFLSLFLSSSLRKSEGGEFGGALNVSRLFFSHYGDMPTASCCFCFGRSFFNVFMLEGVRLGRVFTNQGKLLTHYSSVFHTFICLSDPATHQLAEIWAQYLSRKSQSNSFPQSKGHSSHYWSFTQLLNHQQLLQSLTNPNLWISDSELTNKAFFPAVVEL